jgi:HD-GYP domain-containing protein (c-di-GMP phosphodiesterase class II)
MKTLVIDSKTDLSTVKEKLAEHAQEVASSNGNGSAKKASSTAKKASSASAAPKQESKPTSSRAETLTPAQIEKIKAEVREEVFKAAEEAARKKAEEEQQKRWAEEVGKIREEARRKAIAEAKAKEQRFKDVNEMMAHVEESRKLTDNLNRLNDLRVKIAALNMTDTNGKQQPRIEIRDSNGEIFKTENADLCKGFILFLTDKINTKKAQMEAELKALMEG